MEGFILVLELHLHLNQSSFFLESTPGYSQPVRSRYPQLLALFGWDVWRPCLLDLGVWRAVLGAIEICRFGGPFLVDLCDSS